MNQVSTKQRVFLTGATGTMGYSGMMELLKDQSEMHLVILVRPSKKNKAMLASFEGKTNLEIIWGDLTSYQDVLTCVKNCNIVLHVGAFVSPEADYHPKRAMEINYGSTVNVVRAIKELKQENVTKLVYIGTVAQTGDRMPPIHWGRVGDPIKPSVYDYYAVSKIAAERVVIESELPYWVSLRQTGIIGPAMSEIDDAIMFHNCLNNVLEYVSERDSGILLRNLCAKERRDELGRDFYGHIFNIGGGKDCRIDTYHMFKRIFGDIGLKKLSYALDSKWFATRNFHGHFYLDSDKLNQHLDFQNDGMEYYYQSCFDRLGNQAKIVKFLTSLPGGQKMIGSNMYKRFLKLAKTQHGTVRFIEENMEEHIGAYWGSREAWEAIPPIDDFELFTDWDHVIHIDHGYDENQPETELGLSDVKEAARFRGGHCISDDMRQGDWVSKLGYSCAFGHEFEASPLLILKGGYWCPICERESWNYYQRAKVDDFFAQVWNPLHPSGEKEWKIPKIVSELDV